MSSTVSEQPQSPSLVRANLGQGGCAVGLGLGLLPIDEKQSKGVTDGLGAPSESLTGQGWQHSGHLLINVGPGTLPIYETQTKGVTNGLGAASESLTGQSW